MSEDTTMEETEIHLFIIRNHFNFRFHFHFHNYNVVSEKLEEIELLLESGAFNGDVDGMVRAVRLILMLRRHLTVGIVDIFLAYLLYAEPELYYQLSTTFQTGGDDVMDSDTSTSAAPKPTNTPLPELEIYYYLLILIFLIDQKHYNEAKFCSSECISRLKTINRRASRVYLYYSYVYELTNSLAEIRRTLLALHQVATLMRNELGQETLLNLLLRNYLHYNLYDQAEKLRSKAPAFKHIQTTFKPTVFIPVWNASYTNFHVPIFVLLCRYLFYSGKIQTIQLKYTDAKENLMQAARNAPVAAHGFRIQCNKWAVIVRLLLGEIPERTVFMLKGIKNALIPYIELTNAVRIGNLVLFKTVAEKYAATFNSDKTHNLVVRLRHNAIRTGLRNISISYSRISLTDVAKKLRLDSEYPVADVENIVAKAIRDGAIDATIDHANGWMVSKKTGDVYSTNEPQVAFNSRIAFCLNMHTMKL